MRVSTVYYPKVLDDSYSTYEYLRDNTEWEDGVPSRKGYTRKAKPLFLGDNEVVDSVITTVLPIVGIEQCTIVGIYLNYYRNGDDWTPNHDHKDRKQVVISLGTTRTLVVGKKPYPMSNGDVIVFGSSLHGVPKEPAVTDGRISIALFLLK